MGLRRQLRLGFENPDKLLRTVVGNPCKIVRRSIGAIHDDVLTTHAYYHRRARNRTGLDMMAEDWDNLLLLDACRYDLFESSNTIDGNLSAVISPGSATKEFYENMLSGRSFPETVYATANPNFHSVDCRFHAVERLWENDWDDELRTVPPETVAKQTLAAFEKYPNKRFFVHFIQPHYPFIGETGRQIAHGTFKWGGEIADARDEPSIWDRLQEGSVERDTVWRAYRENLELALPHVQRLVNELGGKSVVTSDHGNVFGKWGEFGHPRPRFYDELVQVPWLEVSRGSRRIIKQGTLETGHDTDESVSDRLAALGYH
jgi:hypothetical protein